jgi:uncharacterized protein YlzI (FlbEa/FlbD family)
VVIKPAEEIQLSQGQKYVVDEKTESNNWNGSWSG